jgi:hypothetical protein
MFEPYSDLEAKHLAVLLNLYKINEKYRFFKIFVHTNKV